MIMSGNFLREISEYFKVRYGNFGKRKTTKFLTRPIRKCSVAKSGVPQFLKFQKIIVVSSRKFLIGNFSTLSHNNFTNHFEILPPANATPPSVKKI